MKQVARGLGSILMLCMLAATGGVRAQALSADQHAQAIDFVLANARHVLMHEIGHLYVDQFDLPVLGKEEDAVDMLATLTLLKAPDAPGVLADAADGWLYSERTRANRGYSNADLAGAHSLDIQRSFTIACLMVGSDFAAHSRFASRFGLSIYRQKSCIEDFDTAQRGWTQLLAPHARTDNAGAEIAVEYRAVDPLYADAAETLKTHHVLEDAAKQMRSLYRLPHPVTLAAETCGEANAYYLPEDRSVILCYEWADFYYQLFAEYVLPAREEAARMRALKLDKLGDLRPIPLD